MKKIEAMSESQPLIPAEELERIEKEAEEFAGPATEEKYPVGYLNRYEGFVAGAKAEHCHLRERIEAHDAKTKEYAAQVVFRGEIIDKQAERIAELEKELKWYKGAHADAIKQLRIFKQNP